MKHTMWTIIPSLCLSVLASLAVGAAVPTVDVVISAAGGKQVYKGTTNAQGDFATGNLAAGNYVVQFNAKGAKGGKFGLAVSAGKNQMSAPSVDGAKLADAGVAMRIAVVGSSKITGHVGAPGSASKPVAAAAVTADAKGAKVKIINGKRYIWVMPQTSSLEGGQWVEESEANKAKGPGDRLNGQPQQQQPRASTGMHY